MLSGTPFGLQGQTRNAVGTPFGLQGQTLHPNQAAAFWAMLSKMAPGVHPSVFGGAGMPPPPGSTGQTPSTGYDPHNNGNPNGVGTHQGPMPGPSVQQPHTAPVQQGQWYGSPLPARPAQPYGQLPVPFRPQQPFRF